MSLSLAKPTSATNKLEELDLADNALTDRAARNLKASLKGSLKGSSADGGIKES